MVYSEHFANSAHGMAKGQDNLIRLSDGAGNEWRIKANGTTKALEFTKNGNVVDNAGAVPVSEKGASYTVVATDQGKLFVATAAATFTLPAIADVWDGWSVEFFNAADANMAVAAPSGKLITFNNAAATSVTFSTSSEKAGAYVRIVYLGTTAKYIAIIGTEETQTMTVA